MACVKSAQRAPRTRRAHSRGAPSQLNRNRADAGWRAHAAGMVVHREPAVQRPPSRSLHDRPSGSGSAGSTHWSSTKRVMVSDLALRDTATWGHSRARNASFVCGGGLPRGLELRPDRAQHWESDSARAACRTSPHSTMESARPSSGWREMKPVRGGGSYARLPPFPGRAPSRFASPPVPAARQASNVRRVHELPYSFVRGCRRRRPAFRRAHHLSNASAQVLGRAVFTSAARQNWPIRLCVADVAAPALAMMAQILRQ